MPKCTQSVYSDAAKIYRKCRNAAEPGFEKCKRHMAPVASPGVYGSQTPEAARLIHAVEDYLRNPFMGIAVMHDALVGCRKK